MTESLVLNSSVLKGATYEKKNNKLSILFNSGKEYEYVVPVEIWEQFKEASSKGKFFNSVIKGRFKPEIV